MKIMAICVAFAEVIKRLMTALIISDSKDKSRDGGNDNKRSQSAKRKQVEKVLPCCDTICYQILTFAMLGTN
jgi:hypothetical protein